MAPTPPSTPSQPSRPTATNGTATILPPGPANPNIPTISSTFTGLPTLGPILETGQRRALLGWTHRRDTPEGLLKGRLWCWVSGGRRGNGGLQVFDEPINRSPFPVGTGRGPNASGNLQIDCGVANFGMVRMFHPWWCPYSRVPKDMNSSDKRICRHRYRQLIARKNAEARRNRNRRNMNGNENENGNANREGEAGRDREEATDLRMEAADTVKIGGLLGLSSRNVCTKRRREVLMRDAMRAKREGCTGDEARVGVGKGTVEEPVVLESDKETLVRGSASCERSPSRESGRIVRDTERAGANAGTEMGGHREPRPDELEDDGTTNDHGTNGGIRGRDVSAEGSLDESFFMP